MIKLDFKVDSTYLVYYLLVNCSSAGFIPGVKSREAVVEFENLAFNKNPGA